MQDEVTAEVESMIEPENRKILNSRRLAQEWAHPRMGEHEKVLRDAAGKWFRDRGLATHPKMPYLLDKWENWDGNIILPEVAKTIVEERKEREGKKGFPLHKYVHHGLSSQAMLFNLIGPLIVRNDLAPLKEVIEAHGLTWPEGAIAEYEYEDRNVFNEDSGQPTSIDLWVHTTNNNAGSIFIESKLVEREFGGCSVFSNGDCDGFNPCKSGSGFSDCYLDFIGRTYWRKLASHGFLDGPLRADTLCILGNYYQFFREVLFAIEKNGVFILLVDQRNPAFESQDGSRGLWPKLIQLVPQPLRPRLAKITVQEVAQAIEKSGRHNDWIGTFKEKYALEK